MCSKNKEARFFELARRQAENGQFPHKIGCVVIYKGRVISEGYNIKKTHPLQLKYDKERPDLEEGSPNIHSMHAEIRIWILIGVRLKFTYTELQKGCHLDWLSLVLAALLL